MRAVGTTSGGVPDVFVHRDCVYLMLREGGWEEVKPDPIALTSTCGAISSQTMEDETGLDNRERPFARG